MQGIVQEDSVSVPESDRTDPYHPQERARLERSLREGESLTCPRCEGVMERRDIPPHPDVPYVRSRTWLICTACGRSAVMDRADRG